VPDRLVSANVYVWMQTYARSHEDIGGHWPDVLDDLRAAGYPGVEPFLSVIATDEAAADFDRMLEERELRASSFYTGGQLHDASTAPETVAGILAAARRAPALGARGLTVNPDPIGRRKTDAELATQAEALNRLGEGLRALGLGLWVHNHTPEMAEQGRELRHNLEATDPALVGFCADVHWLWRGGGDPYAYLEQYADRLGALHLRNSRDGVWSETLGDGDLDYRRVRRILDEARFSGPLMVELALEEGTPHTQPLVESMRQSRAYLREVFGV